MIPRSGNYLEDMYDDELDAREKEEEDEWKNFSKTI